MVLREEPGSYEFCPVCDWENDGVQYADPNYRGGANERSLVEEQARSVRRFPYGTLTVGQWVRDPWWRPLMLPEVTVGRGAVTALGEGDAFMPYWSRSPLGWDTVLTSDEWSDGPIAGVANWDGHAHMFAVTFDELADSWNYERVELRAIDGAMVDLEIERSQIRRRWSDARLAGKDVQASPALSEDHARYQRILSELAQREPGLRVPFYARPEWARPPDPPGACGWLAVRWTRLP